MPSEVVMENFADSNIIESLISFILQPPPSTTAPGGGAKRASGSALLVGDLKTCAIRSLAFFVRTPSYARLLVHSGVF